MSDLSVIAGETIDIAFGPVTVGDPPVAVDLRLANTKLRFVAKRNKDDDDADAEWNKLYVAGVTEDQGILVPVAAPNNNGTITITADETRDILTALDLVYELILVEPNARVTRLKYGRIRVGRAVLNAAP